MQFAVCIIVLCMAIGIPGVIRADWEEVEAILQRKGQDDGNSLNFSYPRIDRKSGKGKRQEICPSTMASDVIFRKIGKEMAELEGIIVAVPQEKPAVERKLLAEGLHITKVEKISGSKGWIKIHFSGRGDPVSLVWAFTPALSATDTPMGPPLFPAVNRCIGPGR